jgi:hypothetical protein
MHDDNVQLRMLLAGARSHSTSPRPVDVSREQPIYTAPARQHGSFRSNVAPIPLLSPNTNTAHKRDDHSPDYARVSPYTTGAGRFGPDGRLQSNMRRYAYS